MFTWLRNLGTWDPVWFWFKWENHHLVLSEHRQEELTSIIRYLHDIHSPSSAAHSTWILSWWIYPSPISTVHLGRSNPTSRPMVDQGRLRQLEGLITLTKGWAHGPNYANMSKWISEPRLKQELPGKKTVFPRKVWYRFCQELMCTFVSWGREWGWQGANTWNMRLKPRPQKAERRGREKWGSW